jgi:hypothetical protein
MEHAARESKLIFVDSEGKVRSLHGLVTVEDNGFVRVDRRDGSIMIPMPRVLAIEAWTGGLDRDEREARP